MIKIGTSGFSFGDWKGTVYPKHLQSKDMLNYYQDCLGFDMVELDFTFYAMPSQRAIHILSTKTHNGFQFLIKAHRLMTHHIRDPHTLKIRDNSEAFHQFLQALEPLMRQEKLGCVLFQFPQFFHFSGENMSYLVTCKQRMGEIPIAVEFRCSTWDRDTTFEFLEQNNIVYCVTDQTPIEGVMPFVNRITSSTVAYYRLHGRDSSWIDRKTGMRHAYLYSDTDLSRLKGEINHVANQTRATYICFNNCHAGASARNAKQMKRLLGIPDLGRGNTFDLFDSSF